VASRKKTIGEPAKMLNYKCNNNHKAYIGGIPGVPGRLET
jgi:hypothetical protein